VPFRIISAEDAGWTHLGGDRWRVPDGNVFRYIEPPKIQVIDGDVREEPVDDVTIWRDGRCLKCKSPTHETSASYAPLNSLGMRFSTPEEQRVGTNLGEPDAYDYYLWCSNSQCEFYSGECMFDDECPPDWADHDKS
jgi:hypothetical protein